MYKVIDSRSLDEFEELVEEALKDGWNLVGGVSVVPMPMNNPNSFEATYFQAMTK